MVKSVKSRGNSEKWTAGGDFLFNEKVTNKKSKTDRRLTMTPKKDLKPVGVKKRRQSTIMKRLEIDCNTVVSPTNMRRTRRQSMVNLKKDDKKKISRATSEKVLPNKKSIQVRLSPLKEAPVKAKSTTRVRMNRRESMGKITTIIPKEKVAAKKTKEQSAAAELLQDVVSSNLVTPTARKPKGRPPKSAAKTLPSSPKARRGRPPSTPNRKVTARKVSIAVTPKATAAVDVQLALAEAVTASAKVKVKRLGGRSPVSGSRSLRSARKVKILVESPPRTEKFRKTPAIKNNVALDSGASPNFAARRKAVKPFTPKPDNPYDILKKNMRKRVTSRIDMMDMSPDRTSQLSFASFASTPSSSLNVPPTPKSSRPRLSTNSFTGEKRSLRGYRKMDISPLSSTPIKGSDMINNSAYLSMDESMPPSDCTDGPKTPSPTKDGKGKKGYCSIM